jgi:regulator of sirC expression with transglutaminase-like and TPR domain
MTVPTPQEARRLFSKLVGRRDQEIYLAEAVLLVAADQGSDADVEGSLTELDELAKRVEAHLKETGVFDPQLAPMEAVDAINTVLFLEKGFTGNREDYYDPENSYLNKVLERRTGIPITLSIVYIEVARRVGLDVKGIGLPGHFVVGHWPASASRLPSLIIDPFNEGQLLTVDDCAARVHAAYGDDIRFTREWLQPMTNRQILARVLNNLKHIYMSLEQRKRALRTVDMLLMVQPDAIWELKERGLLYYRMGNFVLALADLRRYIKSTPEGEDTDLLKYHVHLLQRLITSSN